jgi:hypothetical protein
MGSWLLSNQPFNTVPISSNPATLALTVTVMALPYHYCHCYHRTRRKPKRDSLTVEPNGSVEVVKNVTKLEPLTTKSERNNARTTTNWREVPGNKRQNSSREKAM